MNTNMLLNISNEELNSRANAIRAKIRREREQKEDTTQLEVELCYCEREEELRQIRSTMHQKYMQKYLEEEREIRNFWIKEEAEAERESYKFDNDMSWTKYFRD